MLDSIGMSNSVNVSDTDVSEGLVKLNNPYILSSLEKTTHVLKLMQSDVELLKNIDLAIEAVYECLKNNGKVMFAGNGGSAADSQHMSAEFVSRFMFDRPGLPSIALTTDTSALTAIGNDYGFENLFSRQVQALGNKDDVLIVYSTSGTSPNILKALTEAKRLGIKSIGLTGNKEKSKVMVDMCDITIRIPSDSTPYIQEGHLVVGHILCGTVENKIFG